MTSLTHSSRGIGPMGLLKILPVTIVLPAAGLIAGIGIGWLIKRRLRPVRSGPFPLEELHDDIIARIMSLAANDMKSIPSIRLASKRLKTTLDATMQECQLERLGSIVQKWPNLKVLKLPNPNKSSWYNMVWDAGAYVQCYMQLSGICIQHYQAWDKACRCLNEIKAACIICKSTCGQLLGLFKSLYVQELCIKPLARCAQLEWLELQCSFVEDIAPLAACRQLVLISLHSTAVTDVAPLSSCTALQAVIMDYTDIADISALASCPNLKLVTMSSTKVADISSLSACKQLMVVSIANCPTVASLQALESCPELLALDIKSTKVADISPLAACSKLQVLAAGGSKLASIQPLEGHSMLRAIDIANTPVADVRPLASCQQLQVLCFQGSQVQDLGTLAVYSEDEMQPENLTGRFLDQSTKIIADVNETASKQACRHIRSLYKQAARSCLQHQFRDVASLACTQQRLARPTRPW